MTVQQKRILVLVWVGEFVLMFASMTVLLPQGRHPLIFAGVGAFALSSLFTAFTAITFWQQKPDPPADNKK